MHHALNERGKPSTRSVTHELTTLDRPPRLLPALLGILLVDLSASTLDPHMWSSSPTQQPELVIPSTQIRKVIPLLPTPLAGSPYDLEWSQSP